MAKSPKKYLIKDTIIIDNIYTLVEKSMKTKSSSLKSCIERFIHKRHDSLYDYAPVDRIFFRKADSDDFFKSLNISQKEITDIMPDIYYWKEQELAACKDEFSLTCLMVVRYLLINEKSNTKSFTELVATYLAFSGKFYASCHYDFWKEHIPNREVMDYVVNYMLSQKFDLIKTHSVWGMINSLTKTWIETYKEEIVGELTDERVSYVIHQLYNRIHSCLKNIANNYYKAWNEKLYLNKESDNFNDDNYRISNNNSTIASTITEKTMIYISNTQVNIAICYKVAGNGVDALEIKAIFENILSDNSKLDELRFVINVMITDFMNKYPNEKDLTGPAFIAHSISMKPNTKDQNILKQKNIILNWLNTSDRYRLIKTQATKNNYFKAILGYIAITVNFANKE